MRQQPVDHTEIEPGHAYEWHLVPSGDTGARHIASYNQAAHHAAAAATGVTSYIAGSFELPGPVDLDALGTAFRHLVRRHEVLRIRSARGLSCTVFDDFELERVDVDCPADLHQTFQRVDTLSSQMITMGAVVRTGSTTVHFSFDHFVSDVWSVPIAIADITHALAHGTRPPAASYLAFARAERERNQAMHAGHAQLAHWKDVARDGEFFPLFPLDLGLEPGRWYPPVNETETLLTDQELVALDTRCREAGGGLFLGLLACMAVSVRELGGPEVYRALVPVNERGETHADAVGWFINALPVEVPATGGFAEILAGARASYESAREHRDVHHLRAWQLLAPAEARDTGYRPVSFFSYLDFRRAPGIGTAHLWFSGSNGFMFWLHRDDTGLHINTIHADTPRARSTRSELIRAFARTARDFTNGR